MRRSLLATLADPATGESLDLVPDVDPVETGVLRSPSSEYPVRDGIPRFVDLVEDPAQEQTAHAFGYKWLRRDSYGSEGMQREARSWFLARYGFESPEAMRSYLAERAPVLDAGCGSGFSTSIWLDRRWDGGLWVGADISEAIDVARERLGDVPDAEFVQGDVSRPPFRPGTFGAIVSEGVLHHTPSTRNALAALVELLRPGGEVLFYVYRRKAPLREYADDYVRERLAGLPPEEAWEKLRSLTELGRALAELEVEVDVPVDVELLEIPAGRYDVQRLVYWHVAKLYWNPALTFEENHHVNFDWYHPRYAHRQTEDEVRSWCDDLGLEILRFDAQESGFTVRARRTSP